MSEQEGWKKMGGTVGGSYHKPWQNPGDEMEGIFCGLTSGQGKFGPETVLSWRHKKTDEQFRTRAPAALARMAAEFKEGNAYKIIFKSMETTARGFQVKTFDVYEEDPF
jgi:hypothetical protein